jgi:alcohol dehydrogenase
MRALVYQDVTITTGLVDTSSTARLLSLVMNDQIDPSPIVTQTFPMSQMIEAYDVFARAGQTGALKVVCRK